MTPRPNILFIMADQLRWDYLSCYGHPHLETPNIDRIARQGVRFDRVYCQAPLCGPSRASIYSGRYMSSCGVYWNSDPVPIGNKMLGDYLRPLGYRTMLVGKSHFRPDRAGMERLGIDLNSPTGQLLAQGGFEPFDRDNGIRSDEILAARGPSQYDHYLRELGYDAHNPWDRNANGVLDDEGNFASGWFYENAPRPANIAEEHTETPYMTRRAIDCIEAMGDEPWCIHLSYIKPHWPYIAPAPYHNMYGPADMLPRNAVPEELADPHPVYRAFADQLVSRSFSEDEVREMVVPVYMGLVKQLDDQIGVLLDYLEGTGRMANTFIVFCSDHGDYLGDHWLGEKDNFHDEAAKVPLLIYDPSPAADDTRGKSVDALVEMIDLVPTFVELAGGQAEEHSHILEGASLRGWLHGEFPDGWRTSAVSEIDFSGRSPRQDLGLTAAESRGYMLRTERWKYLLWEGFGCQLFDLEQDAHELVDLGRHPDYAVIRGQLKDNLFTWLRRRKNRVATPTAQAEKNSPQNDESEGVLMGYWRAGDFRPPE
ncbi:MAG: sulfatase-like hydrolase/transferase [Ardenticatenales bacterium]|nr:sulfatase-like hydrolase/transferase [Ardenticatenales bacterium]